MSSATLNDFASLQATVSQMQTDYNASLDTIWLLITGYLVWFMGAGFAFLELGGLRARNSQHVLGLHMLVPLLTFTGWYILGFPLAFGVPTSYAPGQFAGANFFAMDGFYSNQALFKQWFFQGAFADTTASIVSGAIAERMTLVSFLIHTVCMVSIIYPIGVYWAWSGVGWLSFPDPGTGRLRSYFDDAPYLDWAGSGVIHFVGGVAALVGAIIVGPRKGRFDPNVNQDEEFLPYSIPYTVLGTFILWFGWYGFNPGCIGALHTETHANQAALCVVNTTLGPCAGGLIAVSVRAICTKKFDVPALCNGLLAGLVGITAPCGYVSPWEAIIIGAVSGLIYCISSWLVVTLKIDDPIDAVSVHMSPGAWGTIAVGLFGDPRMGMGGNGVFYAPYTKVIGGQLGVQIVALICYGAWAAAWSIAIFLPLKKLGLLQYSEAFQEVGANEMLHTPRRYHSGGKQSREFDTYDTENPSCTLDFEQVAGHRSPGRLPDMSPSEKLGSDQHRFGTAVPVGTVVGGAAAPWSASEDQCHSTSKFRCWSRGFACRLPVH